MKELALHILDVAENGISAGADRLKIIVDENRAANRLVLTIEDNGHGMPADIAFRAADPFFTTRTTRRVGLGLSLLENAARRCNGEMTISSETGRGSRVTATFAHDHIDRAPLGDMAATLIALIAGYPDVALTFNHNIDGHEFIVDTMAIKKRFGNRPITDPEVWTYFMALLEPDKGNVNHGENDH